MHTFNRISLLTKAFFAMLGISMILDANSQDIGIGTASPDYRLHVFHSNASLLKIENSTTLGVGIASDFFFKTGLHYTGAIKTIGTGTNLARLGLFTYAATNSSSLIERISIMDDGKVGIGTITPAYLLDLNGRMRIRNGGGTAGLYLMNAANNDNAAFVGLYNDDYVGFNGDNGGGWNLVMNTTNGRVGIGTQSPAYLLHVTGSTSDYLARLSNSSALYGAVGLTATADESVHGIGLYGRGSGIGVQGFAIDLTNGSDHYGVYAQGKYADNSNYGVYSYAQGGTTAVGVYGEASGGTTNWGGYFAGNVYTTGAYQGSDRKLKTDIRPLTAAMQIVNQLKPSVYTYRTEEFKQMNLQEGLQYGLIADELQQVLPQAVKKTIAPVHPADPTDPTDSTKHEALEFYSVNYTMLIPILIGAIQEQNATIEDLKSTIEVLEGKVVELKKK